MPVSDRIKSERERVAEKDFVYEVRRMYQGGMQLSQRFSEEFKAFWSLPKGFVFEPEKAPKQKAWR